MAKSTKPSKLILAFVKITGFIPALLFYKYKIYYSKGAKHSKKLPKPCIFMSNHKSLMDFPLYLIMFPFRNIRFLMAEVLYNKGKLFGWFLYKLGGIKVDRNSFDFGFVGEALEALDNGETVGIFPESRLPINRVPWPFKPSIAFIATKTDAEIIPVYTDGNYGLFKRAHVIIGEPINIHEFCKEENPSMEEYERLTLILQNKMADLGNELKAILKK